MAVFAALMSKPADTSLLQHTLNLPGLAVRQSRTAPGGAATPVATSRLCGATRRRRQRRSRRRLAGAGMMPCGFASACAGSLGLRRRRECAAAWECGWPRPPLPASCIAAGACRVACCSWPPGTPSNTACECVQCPFASIPQIMTRIARSGAKSAYWEIIWARIPSCHAVDSSVELDRGTCQTPSGRQGTI